MDGGDDGNLVIKKRFVSEAELDERCKRRQEEWEKVKKPEDPEECPEEVYDPQSLYERLQKQKDRKQQECEEQFKFKNMVRGLDEDEASFLDEVSWQQELIEKQQREEELKELKEYRSHLNKVGVSSENKKEVEKKAVKPIETKNKLSQAKLSAGAVKRKSSESGNSVKRLKLDADPDDKSQEAPSCVSLGSTSHPSTARLRPSASASSRAWAPTPGAETLSPAQTAKAPSTPRARSSPPSFEPTPSLRPPSSSPRVDQTVYSASRHYFPQKTPLPAPFAHCDIFNHI